MMKKVRIAKQHSPQAPQALKHRTEQSISFLFAALLSHANPLIPYNKAQYPNK